MQAQLKSFLAEEIKQRQLPADFLSTVEASYLPVAEYISQCWHENQQTLVVSFNGSQGSGKSTLTAFLRFILTRQFGLKTVEMSIDDFYLTHAERKGLAYTVHPLLQTRGVPGTHDVSLARETIECLKKCTSKRHCVIPVFNKAMDDRATESKWHEVSEKVQVILFEGWCNHAPIQTDEELQSPINDLERDEDAKGEWRRYANDALKRYHEELFSMADILVYLKVPSFEKVYEWRGLQEKKLAQKQSLQQGGHSRVMNEAELKRFIQHYERITRQCLLKLPQLADVLLKLNADHGIDKVLFQSGGRHNV